ncbi:MAG TPA: hypothetical protein DDW82_01990 [Acholeplasmataceae bacterium]|jgi:hypothetical protein|nr:hypothetical protein [Acholeplasmataceae bacterium]HCB66714.1 hypothetical protein [Acholeplasmataceae bacterium]
MYTDSDGDFPILILIGIVFVTATAVHGAAKAYKTAKSLGSEGWELAGYTTSGLILGDYLPVKDNWDSISADIKPYDNETDQYINFNFNKGNNKYYSIYTAGLFSKYLKENIYSDFECRTNLGMYLELQTHYGFEKIFGNWYTNGNPAMLGDTSTDSTARLFEGIARFIYDFGSLLSELNNYQ